MRTVITPLDTEVQADLEALEARLERIARGYIRRLALQPQLGSRCQKGVLAARQARRVYFDERDRPADLLAGPPKQRVRRGDQDPSAGGPRFRIVYLVREAPSVDLRLVVILAVGRAHTDQDVYADAARRALRIERRPT